MAMAADSTSPASARIQAALLDYFEAPGKYPIGSRQPEILFNAMQDVLQIAAGRAPNSFGAAPEVLQDAAAFFVGAALLYPGADHYALLGLPAAREPLRLKERYRLLMRLIHPDFAGSVRANWPKDSAMRVNRAYEVLASPVLRREYDEHLANSGAHQRGTASHAVRRTAPPAPRTARVPRLRIGKTAAWAAIVILSLIALAMLLPTREPARIVQKPKTPISEFSKTVLTVPRTPAELPRTPDANEELVVQTTPLAGSQGSPMAASPQIATTTNARVPQTEVAVRDAAMPLPSPLTASAPSAAPHRMETLAPTNGEVRSAVTPVMRVAPPIALSSPEPAPHLLSVAVRPRPAPTLTDAQLLLSQLLQSLESGNSEQLLQVLDSEVRHTPSAQALSRHYRRLVGSNAVKLSHAEFRAEPREDVLVVTGNLRLQIGPSTVGSLGEKLVLRAEFVSRGGRVALTGLSEVAE